MSETHAQSVLYVRDTMLPQQEPPITQKGAVKWVRENLFSSWLNAILTILSIYVVYTLVSHLYPWFANSVWTAGSLGECREVLAVEGASTGACFAVISDRWLQLMFGFYPSAFYWRPILTFVLLVPALAPILYSERVPTKMLWFSGLYPFLATWLLWGGSFWVPLLVIAGFVVGALLFIAGSRINLIVATVAAILGALFWWLFAAPSINASLHHMVGQSRAESILQEATALRAELVPELAALEARKKELEPVIAAANAEKAALVEAAIAEGSKDEDAKAAFLAKVDELQVLRRQDLALAAQIVNIQQEMSDARALLSSIPTLPTLEEQLPTLRATYKELEAALPSALRGLRTPNQAPDGTSAEDLNALNAALSAKSNLDSAELAIASIYGQIGIVGLEPVNSRDFGGFMLALVIGLAGISLSMGLGIMLALGRQSNLFIIHTISVAFIEIIRGVPLIVWLFTASLLLNYFLPPGTEFDLMLRVVIMVTFFSSAYIAEVVRGGLAALPKGQYEAADALGLDYWKSMRLIVLPQALKISIPGIVNTFIGLFKDTTLVMFIGLLDPIGLSNSIRATSDWNGIYWELFVFIGLLFFVFCFSMGRYSLYLEKKLQRDHR